MSEIFKNVLEIDLNSDSNLLPNDSLDIVERTQKIKIFSTSIISVIGLIGHFLTVLVFSQKRFRKNSGNVVSLCLALTDGLFLILNFFADILIKIQEIYLNDSTEKPSSLEITFQFFNLTDKNDISCSLMIYMKYVLRFVSAYSLMVFSLQRFLIVHYPFKHYFKSKKSSFKTITAVVIIALVLNVWTLPVFKISSEDLNGHCGVNSDWQMFFNFFNGIYIFSIIFIPILTITICNTLIIIKIAKEESKNNVKFKINQVCYLNETTSITRIQVSSCENISKKITIRLIIISFSYAFLNLPYMVVWFISVNTIPSTSYNMEINMYAAAEISEIFCVLNYSIHFYLCLFGSLFRNQVKNLRSNEKNPKNL